jgi:ribosomal protein S18 acetylase RimI-like enzyme
MTYTKRLYADDGDYAAMRRLIADSYKLVAPHHYMLLGDLDWWHAFVDAGTFMRTVPLWFAGETLVGFCWPGGGDILLHPHRRAAEPLMLAWAEEHLPKSPGEGKPPRLMQVSLATDVQRNQLLAENGFVRSEDFLASHIFELDQPAPLPQLPPGFRLSDMQIETDWQARVNVHRAAFDPSRFSLQMYETVRSSPTYRPDLDLVAVAPNGDIAAYCIVWFEEENRVALFEPVGCHPAFQRRGLGRAVLCEGLRRLRELGATRAHVGSWLDDSAGAHLYRAAGFQLIDRWYEWHKSYGAPIENAAPGNPT